MFRLPKYLPGTLFRAIVRSKRTNGCLLALALSLLLVSPIHSTSAQVQIARLRANGPYAQAHATFPTGFLFVSVARAEASMDANPNDPAAFGTILFYEFVQNGVYYDGSGLIPNGAFNKVGNKLTLNVDTSALPDFRNNGQPGGVIAIEWESTPGGFLQTSEQSITKIGKVSIIAIGGTSSFAPASSQGTFFGLPFTGPISLTGTYHKVTILIEREG